MAPGDVRAEVNDPPSWIARGRLRFRNPTKLHPAKRAFPPRHRKSVRQRTRPRKRRRKSDTRHNLRFETGRLCARTQLTHSKLFYPRATTTATHQTPIRPPHKRTSAFALAPPHTHTMSYFRITLMRSGIGMPLKVQGVLKALGLRKRMTTVYHPVSQSVAGQIMRIKELIDVKEVSHAMTKDQMRAARRPDPGYYVEKKAGEAMRDV
jgi:large subunit ribosomal protein L30